MKQKEEDASKGILFFFAYYRLDFVIQTTEGRKNLEYTKKEVNVSEILRFALNDK